MQKMKELEYGFTVDKHNNTITIIREYDAPLEKVWKAWTTSEMLDKWWGPKPWRAITKSLDFREGGHWHYSMNGPEGEVQWGKFDYLTIEPNESFTGKDGFSDENGTLDTTLPQNHWELRMSQTGNTVMVDMLLTFEKAEDIDTYIDMGFKEGITQTLDQLEEIL
ncbi:SRPBCC domain-containing protein [Lascolabacillus sp.]|jgi:uncharacterized protein YndB with AHSA1/START domain|uniref:SRPBCC family protein n=1 Tax=Lascolabacillus sp. TaxID=1924068 RepID=UPI00339051BB